MKSGRRLSWKSGKQNAKILVQALNGLANGQLDDTNLRKEVQVEEWDGNHIWVKKTTLQGLSKLTQEWGQEIDPEKIRNAIKCLEKLGFLEDQRSKNNSKTQTGSKEWKFMLKLVDTEPQKNLDWLFGKEGELGAWDLKYKQMKASDLSSKNSYNGKKFTQEQIIDNLEEKLFQWKVKQETFYSSPPAACLTDEQPIFFDSYVFETEPFRIFVHIESDLKTSRLTLDEYKIYKISNKSNSDQVLSIDDYRKPDLSQYQETIFKLFCNQIYPYLFKKTGFKITVFNSFKANIGLNSSDAFSLCFAQGLVKKYLDLDKYKQALGLQDASQQKVILELASALNNCFDENQVGYDKSV